MKQFMTDKEKIELLKSQLKLVLEAYSILEEYACALVGDVEDNDTISHTNSIVNNAMDKISDNL